jgi:hypothetical protein
VIERVIASMYDAQGDLNNAITTRLVVGHKTSYHSFQLCHCVDWQQMQVLQQKYLAQEPRQ